MNKLGWENIKFLKFYMLAWAIRFFFIFVVENRKKSKLWTLSILIYGLTSIIEWLKV